MMVRSASLSDAATIHALTQAAYAEYGSVVGTSTATKETLATVTAQLSANTEALITEVGPSAVACVRFQVEGDALYFHRLAVHPSYRRQGLASALIAQLETLAQERGLRRLTCSVRLEKEDNVALYTKLGFVQLSTRSVCRDGTPVPTGDFEKMIR